MHLLDRFITAKVCDRPEQAGRALGLVPLIGIGLHSFLDGIVYSVGFSVGAVTGLLMALGMVLHEFPEGLVTYTLLLCAGYPARRALLLTFVAASVSTPPGLFSPTRSSTGSNRRRSASCSLSRPARFFMWARATCCPQTAADRGRAWLGLLAGVSVAIAAVAAA